MDSKQVKEINVVIHLYGRRNNVWCGSGFDPNNDAERPTCEPEQSNCKECLKNASKFGRRAASRLKGL